MSIFTLMERDCPASAASTIVSWTLLELQPQHAYHTLMLPPERTPRQRIMELLTGTRLTTHQLAQMLAIPERQVEDHLVHVVKSITRDKSSRFVLEPSRCQDCDFVFRDRRRLTRPSRCPHCRSEGITAPRYGIDRSLPQRESFAV